MRDRARIAERSRDDSTLRAKGRVARDDDVGASGQRPLQRGKGLAAHDDRPAYRHGLEALHVALQPPRNRAAGADHAIIGYRDNQYDSGHGAALASAVSAGPVTRHKVQSSISTA